MHNHFSNHWVSALEYGHPRSSTSATRRSHDTAHHRSLSVVSGSVLVLATISTVAVACAVTFLRIGFVPVLTNSMSPSLEPGSVAITRQVATSDLSLGDAVILPLPDSEGQRYLHRLIEVEHLGTKTRVRTKGDNNPLADPWTLEVTSSTAPVAIASIPYLGWTANVLRSTFVRLVFAALVVLLVGVGLTRLRRQHLDSREQESDDSAHLSGV
jgi:signal peptidase I